MVGGLMRTVELDLSKERMKFSAGHFTIFSATERERLHGHNFTVEAVFTIDTPESGLACDYAVLKRHVQAICDALDERVLLPESSPHLSISQEGLSVRIAFSGEEFSLPARDVRLLPLPNITVEELSGFFLEELITSIPKSLSPLIRSISVRIASGPGQGATSRWEASHVER
jgi:6-pyruvoyltetrahydropterin/6-carboxytetrahydropterin synthase